MSDRYVGQTLNLRYTRDRVYAGTRGRSLTVIGWAELGMYIPCGRGKANFLNLYNKLILRYYTNIEAK